jgi:excisionase family DNA binding protein
VRGISTLAARTFAEPWVDRCQAPRHIVLLSLKETQVSTKSIAVKPKARSLQDGAVILGVCRGTFYNLETAGKIKLIRIGGRTLISEAEIDRLLTNGTTALKVAGATPRKTP